MFFLIQTYINTLIKAVTQVSRPSGEEVRILYSESTQGSSSFPSGHTQGTAAFWGYMSIYYKNKILTLFSIAIILLVGLSRIYLGLHFPIDVLGGLLFAGGILLIYNHTYEGIMRQLEKFSWKIKILLSLMLPLLFLFLPGHDKGMLVGFVIGLLIGYQIEGRYLNFSTKAPLYKQIIKFIIGIIGFFGLRVILKAIFIQIGLTSITELGADVLRYGIIGLWAAYFAPYIFIALKLSEKEVIPNAEKTKGIKESVLNDSL